MHTDKLGGVIAAAATPLLPDLAPDLKKFTDWCRWLLDNGCDGLNLCGTTGEATSFSQTQRMALMDAASRSLPLDRLMVGTGAAALSDAVTLTKHAAALGFAGALVLPPFYYKGVDDDGIVRYIEAIIHATVAEAIDIYLYNFPAMTGIAYTPTLVARLVAAFEDRIVGLKDSSGDMAYAGELVAGHPKLRVFPSNEAVLLDARAGKFAGCISASANINSRWCARAFHHGDEKALELAKGLRALASRNKLIASIKALIARERNDPAFEPLLPPLAELDEGEKRRLLDDVDALMLDA